MIVKLGFFTSYSHMRNSLGSKPKMFNVTRQRMGPRWLLACLASALTASGAIAQRPPLTPINLTNFRVDFIQVGARPAALGGAFIGAAQDETAAPINPAGLTHLSSIGVSLHQRRGRFKFTEPQGSPENPDARRNFHTTNFDQTMVSLFVPIKGITFSVFRQAVFDTRFNFETEQFLTVEAPLSREQALGGLGNFPGRKVDLDLEMVTDAVSVAFSLSRRVSVGVSGKVSVLDFKLSEKTFLDPNVITGQSPRSSSAETIYSDISVDERIAKASFSLGLMATILSEELFFGAVYHANPAYRLRSRILLSAYEIAGETLPTEFHDNSTFTFAVPDVYGAGLYYINARNRLRFTFDIVRVQYSDLLEGNVTNLAADDFDAETGDYRDPDGKPDVSIDDATEIHVGVEYLYKNPRFGIIPLRFGVFTNPGHRIYATGTDPNLRRLLPKASDRLHFTFGLGILLTSHLKFDSSINISEDGLSLIGSTLLSIPF